MEGLQTRSRGGRLDHDATLNTKNSHHVSGRNLRRSRSARANTGLIAAAGIGGADGLAGRSAPRRPRRHAPNALLELLGEFDADGAIRYWTDFKSLAHWLSWSCSMTPGVAREHVRVAKALRRMPTIARLFREGRLSYSKVREVTRVVDVVDEQKWPGWR